MRCQPKYETGCGHELTTPVSASTDLDTRFPNLEVKWGVYSGGLLKLGEALTATRIPDTSSIALVDNNPSYYDYRVDAYCRCPAGYASLTLNFTDETNDTYRLTVISGTYKTHYVRYNSDKPSIKKIEWLLK